MPYQSSCIKIGKFTGTIYPEDYDFSECPECYLVFPADTLLKDILRIHETKFHECLVCLGCPAKKVNCDLKGGLTMDERLREILYKHDLKEDK